MDAEILELIKAGMDIELSNETSFLQNKIIVYFEDGKSAIISVE